MVYSGARVGRFGESMMTNETWLAIGGCEGFEVSDHGRVRSLPRKILCRDGRIRRVKSGLRKLRLVRNENGKPSSVRVTIRGKSYLVHALVLTAFRGPRPKGQEGCHNDGNATHNRLSNLRWDTRESNVEDVYRHGVRKRDWRNSPFHRHGRAFVSAYLCGIAGLI